ncbi:MAG: DUF1573 domain-containing protein [Candidatus Krumholzibacteria bacterium]|nr:DUF1573 domain-containing protein [Candidatus Krumholzibacteria bacterium]
MKSHVARGVSLALFVAFVLATVVMAADDEKHPNIIIEEMQHDLGKIYEEKVFKHAFKVKNTGDADLRIESVKPG